MPKCIQTVNIFGYPLGKYFSTLNEKEHLLLHNQIDIHRSMEENGCGSSEVFQKACLAHEPLYEKETATEQKGQ